MADFAFPLPQATDSLPYFTRPGVILPELDTPQKGYFDQGNSVEPDRIGSSGTSRNPAKANSSQNLRNSTADVFILPTTYSEFWANKLHVIPRTIDVGNVLTPKQQTIELYNAYEWPSLGSVGGVKQVNDIQVLNDAYIEIISGNTTTPFVLGLQQGEVYVYEVAPYGPSTIDANINFGFTSGELVIHYVNGTRSVVFIHEPQLPIRETFNWLTDVMKAVSGTERRQSLRSLPNQQVQYTYLSGDNVIQPKIENFLRARDAVQYQKGVPVWLDRTYLTAEAPVGAATIYVETTANRDFRANSDQGLVILYDPDTQFFEVVTASTINATSIVLLETLLNTWPVRTEVYPLRLCLVSPESFGQKLWLNDARETSITWDVVAGVDNGSEAGWSTYKGTVVFEDDLTIGDTDSYQRQWSWELQKLGGKTSKNLIWTLRGTPDIGSRFTLFWDTKAQYWRIRQWLHARRGKQKSFWLTTRHDDFLLYQDEGGTSAEFKCVPNDYVQVFPEGKFVDIEVVYTDGTRDYREITNVIDAPGLYHTIYVDSNFSKVMTSANVWRISLMLRHRLNSDTVEFFYETTESGSVLLDVIEVPA